MTKSYPIKFDSWKDYVKGLEIASDNGEVQCRPDQVVIVSGKQAKAIDEAGVSYSHLYGIEKEKIEWFSKEDYEYEKLNLAGFIFSWGEKFSKTEKYEELIENGLVVYNREDGSSFIGPMNIGDKGLLVYVREDGSGILLKNDGTFSWRDGTRNCHYQKDHIDINSPQDMAREFTHKYIVDLYSCISRGDFCKDMGCSPPAKGIEQNDMGAYGGPNNCDWS